MAVMSRSIRRAIPISLLASPSGAGAIATNVPLANGLYPWTAGSYNRKEVAKVGWGYVVQIITTDGADQATSSKFLLKK